MRTVLLALVVLGGVLAFAGIAVPPASASCTSPTQLGCVCVPTYYGGQGIHGGVVWRCVAQTSAPDPKRIIDPCRYVMSQDGCSGVE